MGAAAGSKRRRSAVGLRAAAAVAIVALLATPAVQGRNHRRRQARAARATVQVAPAPAPATAPTLQLPSPAWYTPDLHQRVLASGHSGVEVPLGQAPLGHDRDILGQLGCLGYSPPGTSLSTNPPLGAVSAGGCMVHPSGCTMNFVFADGVGNRYIGTAGHCVNQGGDVIMQVASRVDPTGLVFATLAKIGTTVTKVDAGVGADFGLVRIDPGWPVISGIAGAAGPTGALCLDPLGQPVAHYGHGYVFMVGPGQAKFGQVIADASLAFNGKWDTGYNWAGYGVPGDSGSGVMNDAGLAVGDLSHGVSLAGVPVPGLSFGTTMSGIFSMIPGYSLVTVDGRQVRCPGNLLGLVGI